MQEIMIGKRGVLALALLCGSFAFATDYHVSTTGADANDGLTAETAFATIDRAIDVATASDTIYVASGTYQTTTQWGPNLKATMVGTGDSRDDVVIESAGSYRTLRTASTAVVKHLTIVGNKDYKADKGGAVEMTGGLLEDCVVKNGTASNATNPGGGNVYVASDGVISNCEIFGGKAKRCAGNVYVEKGTIVNCNIHDGFSEGDAGNLYMVHGLVSKCTIADGQAKGDGGNIRYYDNADGQIADCVISNGQIVAVRGADGKYPEKKGANVLLRGSGKLTRCKVSGGSYLDAGYDCGSLCIYYSSAVVEDCLIEGSECGGALLAGTTTIYNTTIAANDKYGIWSWGDGRNFYNTILFGNVLDGANKDYTGNKPRTDAAVFGLATTSGGVFKSGEYSNGVILLEDSSVFTDYANGDYRPVKGSALVDSGTPDPRSDASVTDVDGKPRVVNAIDIGCYEYQPVDFTVSFAMTLENDDHIPVAATFTAIPLNADGEVSYTWDFGDGSEKLSTVEATVSHTFENPGKYTVSIVAEAGGETAVLTRENLVVAYDTTIWVNPNGSETFPYNTEATGVKTIDKAISVHSSAGRGEILVAPGLYTTEWQYALDRAYVVRGMGASPEDVIVRNTKQADKSNNWRRTFEVANADARVENLTMEGGSVYDNRGGNLRLTAGVVSNCVIRGGTATVGTGNAAGGGVEVTGSGILTHCVVTNNALIGISGSTVYGGGAGIYMCYNQKSMRLSNCLIAYNTYEPGAASETEEGIVKDGSAGVYFGGANEQSVMENCTVVSNTVVGSVKDDSAGIYCTSWSTTFRNCVVAGNYETDKGKYTSVAFSEDQGTPKNGVVNCVMDDTDTNKSCILYGTTRCAPGDVKTMFKDFDKGNFMPKPGSVLANKGTSSLTLPCEVDLAGKPRVFGKAIDIGCFEAQQNSGLIIVIR